MRRAKKLQESKAIELRPALNQARLRLDRDSRTPFYRQLYERFSEGIQTGILEPGQRLPSARSLAQQLATSRGTVDIAYSMLADEGYSSITAPDVQQAIDALERDNPGLVLLDWSLDDGSGEAVLSAARASFETHTPVVLMTGSSSLSARSMAADAILKKPFDVGELLLVVARYYRR